MKELTSKEKEIMYYLSEGLNASEIMERTGLIYSQFRKYKRNIFSKMEVTRVTQILS